MATPTATLSSITNIGGFGSTVSSVNVSIPATTNTYDQAVLVIATRQKTATISMPANWALSNSLSHTNGNGRVEVWQRVGAYSAGSITISWSSVVNGKIAVLKVDGLLDDCDIAQEASYGSTIAAPSSTSVSTETRAVHVAVTSNDPRRFTVASGLTTLGDPLDHDYIIGMAVGHQSISSAGATAATNNFSTQDTESPYSTLGEFLTAVTMLFSQPSSGSVLVTGTGECPRVASVTVTPPPGPINVGATDDVTVTVLDQNGDGIVNATVVLAFTPTGIVSATAPSVTDANGQTTSTLTGTFGGTTSVAATVGGVTSPGAVVTVTSTAGFPPVLNKRRRRR